MFSIILTNFTVKNLLFMHYITFNFKKILGWCDQRTDAAFRSKPNLGFERCFRGRHWSRTLAVLLWNGDWSRWRCQSDSSDRMCTLLHDVFHSQSDSQIHITAVQRPQFAGSGEPAIKQITLYYWLHNDIAIYRSTIIHSIPFYFICP